MQFSLDWLTDYLTHKCGAGYPVDILERVQFSRGSSRETWFVKFRDETRGTGDRALVFRIDHPQGSTIPTGLFQEFRTYDLLARTDVPIAKPLWFEDDGRWNEPGRPFYVREHVEGDWRVPNFADPSEKFDPLRIETSKEHMRKLAIVHHVDWKKVGFGDYLDVPAGPESCAKTMIETTRARFETFRTEAMPIILEACEYLVDRMPTAPRICLCKGTNGLGEEIFRDGTIVAMSDWEEVSIGDPASDFASMQNFAPEINRNGVNIWGLEKALAYYREVGGIPVTSASVAYYQKVRALTTLVFAHNAACAVHRGETAHIRQAWTGTEIVHLGKRFLAAAMAMMPPPAPGRFDDINESLV